MEPLIQLRNLEKSIEAGPNRFFLLRRVNLDIQPAEFVTIMGPSGAGKSTLLSIIGMLDGAWQVAGGSRMSCSLSSRRAFARLRVSPLPRA